MNDRIRQIDGLIAEMQEVEQTLGRVLGYPKYADDPKNFPNATESDGVCVGEHVGATIAQEAATRIIALRQELSAARSKLAYYEAPLPEMDGKRYTQVNDHRFSDEGICVRCGEDAENWDAGCVERIVNDLFEEMLKTQSPAGG